jgi:hypothetical protein
MFPMKGFILLLYNKAVCRGIKKNQILLITFSLGVVVSLVLSGTMTATTERVSSEVYAVLPPATASSGGDGEGEGGDEGGDQSVDVEGGGGETDGSADLQPESSSDETENEPTLELTENPQPSPSSPQNLVPSAENCNNGQDDDGNGDADLADSDCTQTPPAAPLTSQPNVLPGQGFAIPPNGMLTRDDNLAGKFGLPGLPTPTPLPLTTPRTQSLTLAPDVLSGQGGTPVPTPSPTGTQGLFGSSNGLEEESYSSRYSPSGTDS